MPLFFSTPFSSGGNEPNSVDSNVTGKGAKPEGARGGKGETGGKHDGGKSAKTDTSHKGAHAGASTDNGKSPWWW